jgi:hypothetical protein
VGDYRNWQFKLCDLYAQNAGVLPPDNTCCVALAKESFSKPKNRLGLCQISKMEQ